MKMNTLRFMGVVCTADLHLPTPHKPTEDLLWIRIEIGTQEGLCFELSFRITHQDPTQGYGEQARGVPNRRLGRDFDHAIPAPVPVSDRGHLPNGGRILGHLRKVGQALAWISLWHEGLYEQAQQNATQLPTRPAGAAKHSVVAVASLLLIQAHRAQS